MSFAGAFLILFTSIGLLNNGMGLFYTPVTAELGFTQASFSLYHTISFLICMVTSPIFGRFYTKKPDKMRLSMLISGILLLITFVGYSRSYGLWSFYVFSVIRGFVMGALSATGATMIINNWFIKRRSVMISLAFIGSSIGGICYTQICNFCLKVYDWRIAYLVVGGIAFITIMVAVAITATSPERIGLKPYGYDEKSISAETGEKEGKTFEQAVRTPLFWMLCIGILGTSIAGGIAQVIASALQMDQGFSSDFAANISSIYLVFMCVGKPIMSVLYEKTNMRVSLLYCNVAAIAALVCMYIGSGQPPLAIAFAVLFGLGNVVGTVGLTIVATEAFGLKDYGTNHGVFHMFHSLGIAVSPIVGGYIYDVTNHYGAYWLFVIAWVVLALILFQIGAARIKRERAKETARLDETWEGERKNV